MDAYIIKRLKDKDAYYTILWSKLKKADKYKINASVPAVSWILEIYYKDNNKRFILIYLARVWFGGLRSTIRKLTDPELEIDPKWKHVLTEYDCYYRYVQAENSPDMQDIMFYFAEVLYPESNKHTASGRYEKIFLIEESPDMIDTV